MNKIFFSILFSLFPIVVLAEGSGSLSFAPPPGDFSVVFLGNVFGVVDGVLHGTGSQIMGSMFGVFNAAVLALGGIVIMYTLMVSTVNTAHEGQMLGQKWSSIWVPTRATLGLALLIPKASGYCLMQIFVMWVVIQGVGAADKVWDAALSYLNRGGVIVQAQEVNPLASITGGNTTLINGASTILAGQTCMAGIQQLLTVTRQGYLNLQSSNGGPCTGSPSTTMASFCNTAVPDFIGSVNVVTIQTASPDQTTAYKAPMPNFDKGSPYASLNGVCGTIQWMPFSSASMDKITENISGLSASEKETTKMSRAIALQQLYMDLSLIAKVAVNNDEQLTPSSSSASSSTVAAAPAMAKQQFGVPYLSSGTPCTDPDPSCNNWGSDPSSQTAPLYNGTEFQDAIADYNAIMLPALNLLSQASDGAQANSQRAFMSGATSQGWIMAGSYFFDLAKLNASSTQTTSVVTGKSQEGGGSNPNSTDDSSGLEQSVFSATGPTTPFGQTGCADPYMDLCVWLTGTSEQPNAAAVTQVISLINGLNVLKSPISPNFDPTSHTAASGAEASTIFGYVNNAVMVNLPGQPGMQPPQFGMKFRLNLGAGAFNLPRLTFPCGKIKFLPGFSICMGELLGDIFYNDLLVPLWDTFIGLFVKVANILLMAFLSLPLFGMSLIFLKGVSFIQQPNVNPIIALANMGVNYINFANDMWIFLTEMSILAIIIPFFGMFVLPLLAMVMPLLVAWLGTMIGIGFVTAYYVPFLPYMIFTFGSIAWLMAVIEAMVAAPIVALGITHPEGEGPFGKGEQAIMILMNVFLRPAMMIIGYIAAITLSYVSVWIINAGFGNVVTFIQGPAGTFVFSVTASPDPTNPSSNTIGAGYTGWAGVYGLFFSILIYTSMYLTVVQKAFTLIAVLPDKVLRWIGGPAEQVGQDASAWGDETKSKIGEAGKDTYKAQGQIDKKAEGAVLGAVGAIKADAPKAKFENGPESTPS